MKLIYISFPIHYNSYKYDEEEADKYCKYILENGFLPITCIGLTKQLERISVNKIDSLNKRLELIKRCDELWYFTKETANIYMMEDITIAKSLNIPVKYISSENLVGKYINPYKDKYEEIRSLYNYKEYLNEVNRLIYSGEIYKNSDGFQSEVEVKIREDETLSKVQKRYLIIKISSYEHSTLFHNYTWKLNHYLRKATYAYRYTMDNILQITDIEKKTRLVNKLYESLKYDYDKGIISCGTASMVASYLLRDANDYINDKGVYDYLDDLVRLI